jgi:hypothetical protein
MNIQHVEGWGVIHMYTREQAIADGQLVDVSETPEAKEAGFRIPVCLTAGVHALVQVPELLSPAGRTTAGGYGTRCSLLLRLSSGQGRSILSRSR